MANFKVKISLERKTSDHKHSHFLRNSEQNRKRQQTKLNRFSKISQFQASSFEIRASEFFYSQFTVTQNKISY